MGDDIASLVPESFVEDARHLTPLLRDLAAEDVYRPIAMERHSTFAHSWDELARKALRNARRASASLRARPEVSELYRGKVTRAVEAALREEGWVSANDQGDLIGDPGVLSAIVNVAAQYVAEHRSFIPSTDSEVDFEHARNSADRPTPRGARTQRWAVVFEGLPTVGPDVDPLRVLRYRRQMTAERGPIRCHASFYRYVDHWAREPGLQ